MNLFMCSIGSLLLCLERDGRNIEAFINDYIDREMTQFAGSQATADLYEATQTKLRDFKR